MARRQLRELSDEWELIEAREVHVVDALKQEGNLLFQQQRYFDAIQTYGRALAQIQSIDVASLSHGDGESLEQLETAVRLNRALAYIELQDANLLAYAEEDCSIVLVRQPQCVKALYRRALARERLGKLEKALLDAEQMCALEPANPAALQLLARLQEAWPNEHVQSLPVASELSVGLERQCSLSKSSPSRKPKEDAGGNRTSALDAWTALQVEEQRLREEVFKQSTHKNIAGKSKATAASNKKVGTRRKHADLGAHVTSDAADVRAKTESLWAALTHEESSTVVRMYKTRPGAATDNKAWGKVNPPSAASIHPRR